MQLLDQVLLSVVINSNNGKNLAISFFFHGVLINGRLVGFSDFQRNLRFGSKLADRDVDLTKKADISNVLSFMLSRL